MCAYRRKCFEVSCTEGKKIDDLFTSLVTLMGIKRAVVETRT